MKKSIKILIPICVIVLVCAALGAFVLVKYGDRIKNKIISYKNDEIKEFYKLLKANQNSINITENNFNVVYNQWKQEVRFNEDFID